MVGGRPLLNSCGSGLCTPAIFHIADACT
jgi:hypothetical protein